MPIYDYKCDKCDKVVEKIVTHSNKDNPMDCDCDDNGTLKRLDKISKTNLTFKGKWFQNTGSY